MPDPDQREGLYEARPTTRGDSGGAPIEPAAHEVHPDVPEMTDAELVLLHVRVIALENLLIAVLAEGSDRQRQMAREMADIITPRPGSTQHPLTIRAAQHMTDLVDRAVHARNAHGKAGA